MVAPKVWSTPTRIFSFRLPADFNLGDLLDEMYDNLPSKVQAKLLTKYPELEKIGGAIRNGSRKQTKV